MDKNSVYVKINYNIKSLGSDLKCDARINYIYASKSSKYLIGGGFYSKDKCSLSFKAKSIEEARAMANGNPMIKNWLHRYGNIKLNLMVIPGM